MIAAVATVACGCADELALSDPAAAGRPAESISASEVAGEETPAEPALAPTHVAAEGADAREEDADAPEEEDADAKDSETEAQMWEIIEETFARKGELKDGVYRLVTPRADLFVTMDGMDVPAGAFLESDFRFWRCPCGKLLVNGQFVLADYEVNDVVDELQEGRLEVVTIAPLLLHEHPRLLMVRFQGEGRTRAFAEALKSALSYTGEERNKPQPVDLSPHTPEQ